MYVWYIIQQANYEWILLYSRTHIYIHTRTHTHIYVHTCATFAYFSKRSRRWNEKIACLSITLAKLWTQCTRIDDIRSLIDVMSILIRLFQRDYTYLALEFAIRMWQGVARIWDLTKILAQDWSKLVDNCREDKSIIRWQIGVCSDLDRWMRSRIMKIYK